MKAARGRVLQLALTFVLEVDSAPGGEVADILARGVGMQRKQHLLGMADDLLADYDADDLHGVRSTLSERLWNLLVDVEQLQGDVAGVNAWGTDGTAVALRRTIADRSLALADAATRLGEVDLAGRLSRFGQAMASGT